MWVALCAVAVFKFGVVNQKESAGWMPPRSRELYTALIDEVRMATVNALHEGDKIYDEKTGICLGTITAVKHEPFLKNVLLNDGTIQPVEFRLLQRDADDYQPVVRRTRAILWTALWKMKANSENECSDKICKTRNENHKHQRMSGGLRHEKSIKF